MTKSWFRIKALASGIAEVLIYDDIGAYGVNAADFREQLLAAAKSATSVRVRINSNGGEVFQALAMYNAITGLDKPVEVIVDGIAASAASLVAMAGTIVLMPENAFMMIHLPSTLAWGTSDDMRNAANALDMLRDSMVNIYSKKSGIDVNEIVTMMGDETWLTAARAVELGFADEVTDAVKIAASINLEKFKNAPKCLTGDVKSMSETAAEMEARIRAEMAAGVESIKALCLIAKRADLLDEFIASGKKPEEVRSELLALAVAESAAEVVTAHQTVERKAPAADLDPAKIYAARAKRAR